MLPEDAREVWLSGKRTPQEAIERAVKLSTKSWGVYLDGSLVGVFGYGDTPGASWCGCVWFLRTVHIKALSVRDYMMLSKVCLEWLYADYGVIENMTLSSNKSTIKWLQKLGFTIGSPVYVDQGDGNYALFTHFYKETPNV